MMNKNKVAKAKYEEAGTWVFWDIDDCPVPRSCKSQEIAQKIISALNKLNYCGPLSISAYGDMNHIPPSIKQALSSTGIFLKHVLPNMFRSHMFNEMLDWKYEIPTPANLMVISRSELLSITFDEPKAGHNILLVHHPHSSEDSVAFAKTRWLWRGLLEEP
ncbi:uncharacterized protein LOC112083907 [Eutrema salsugineum]|uniref:uncharacterized protein LOC112083907 n=1 Tax=Eutrema salsugineum TaxID=72664 RepID=UPI000CED3E94|nr:uncharacterized protein LOC112083907 [Eutrema salsugineum]